MNHDTLKQVVELSGGRLVGVMVEDVPLAVELGDANPVVRLGFRIFGRREQVRFAQRACERIARLTSAALAEEDAADLERASRSTS